MPPQTFCFVGTFVKLFPNFILSSIALIPIYMGVKVYEDGADKTKAAVTAKRIVALIPKIHSPATDEMKNKADSLLRRNPVAP